MTTLLVFLGTFFVLVIAHEGGHFLAAKFSRVYVKEFALGFGPKLVSTQRRGTRYSLRLVPVGGYVRLAGEDRLERSDEIPSNQLLYNKHPGVRVFISLSGPSANLVLTFLVGLVAIWAIGVPTIQIGDVIPDKPAFSLLRPGDCVLAIDGRALYTLDAVSDTIQRSRGKPIDLWIERDDARLVVTIAPEFDEEEERFIIGAYFLPVTYTNEVIQLDATTPLAAAGLAVGDRIVDIDGEPIRTAIGVINAINDRLQAQAIRLGVVRGGARLELTLSTNGRSLEQLLAGVEFADLGIDTRRPNFAAGLALGGSQFSENAALLVDAIRGLLTGRVAASEAIAGPIGIAQLLGEGFQRGPSIFLRIVALFSLSLAIANLIPFPALDGSRAAFALYEWMRRRPIPPEREGLIHTIGFVILMVLMILVTYQDLVRLFR